MSEPLPRWGWVTAKPHQFLVHLRRGEVIRGQQGGACFKWPTDTVALLDTSLRRLQFTADQVTREKTGVEVTGLAVFRIVEPLIAYKMLDWTDQETHVDILKQMLLGATRRLVANLTLEECITRRKDALAAELLAEIAPVVGGSGGPDDTVRAGWGIAIDTIEIQDVRVLSEEVFSNLQAPYRQSLALGALVAREEVAREEAKLQHEARQEAERNRARQIELEKARLEAERQRELEGQAHGALLERRQQDAAVALARERQAAQVEADQQRAAVEVVVAQRKAEAERVLGEARAATERALREAQGEISEGRLRELLVQQLPEVARAYANSFDRIVVTGASDLSVLGEGVAQVLATAQALGVALPRG
jgi:flotillin